MDSRSIILFPIKNNHFFSIITCISFASRISNPLTISRDRHRDFFSIIIIDYVILKAGKIYLNADCECF